MYKHLATSFVDENGNVLGNDVGVIPIPLYKGMQITIHGHQQTFAVVDWSFHLGHQEEGAGLKIVLK